MNLVFPLRYPVFADVERTERAATLHTVLLTTLVVGTVFLSATALVESWFDAQRATRALLTLGALDLLCVSLLIANHVGYFRTACWALIGAVLTITTLLAIPAGGVRSGGVTAHFVFVLMAGTLLGMRAGVVTAVISSVLMFSLLIAEIAGLLPEPSTYSAPSRLLLNLLYLGVVLALLRLGTNALQKVLDRARRELAARKEADAERERLLFVLGERVKELGLLQRASRLLQAENRLTQSMVEQLVALLPAAFLDPSRCQARITYGDMSAATPGFLETAWLLRVPLRTSEGTGAIEVAYVSDPPTTPTGPFLPEEKAMLRSLAEIIEVCLGRDIAERHRRAVDAHLRQSRKMEALGTLAGGIAHDFNNILTAIGGNVELARLDIPEQHPARESLDDIAMAHGRARDMVARILAFSRKQEPAMRFLDIVPVVEEVAKLLEAALSKRIAVRRVFGTASAPVRGDPSQLHQVLMNLGTNAAHAMRDSGGELTFEVSTVVEGAGSPLEGELAPGRYVRVSVRDTGTGIPPDVLERVFEPFFTTKGDAGTGLGLSVVHSIVRDHSGAITVESAVGAGTTFTIYLPEASAVPAEASR